MSDAPHLDVSLLFGGLKFAASTPNFLILEYQPDQRGPMRDLVRNPLKYEDGHVLIPDQPGLGIELNEAAFAGKPRAAVRLKSDTTADRTPVGYFSAYRLRFSHSAFRLMPRIAAASV